ncbi:ankyrin repeat and sterile alpha motif domain-containing protein 1B [Elysia marginata]|uniref:Ankyrin repeat and sterile alpha motif domain-containing protein 1B n=1 Tax=Elysia marginata TaxID=1093978 RepID=A0AAV4FJI7_9GAST|nr:ankyrin repeat and sterile alpha motif domain-containing protein 1B [Elysia marginata]
MGKDQELLDACRKGNLAIVEKLLSAKLAAKGKGPKAAGTSSGGTFSLIKSISTSLKGANVNCVDHSGDTPLHLAALNGFLVMIVSFRTHQKGGDPIIRNLEDKSPLDLAAQYDRMDIVTQLVTSHPELLAQRSVQNTPLHLASRLGHKAVVRYLLDSGFPIDAKTDKGSALHEAANFCKLDVIRLLLERGIDISVKSHTGCTAEDILRSIPSRAAEEALNILKTHIYHQRTPDSDGEKSIAGDTPSETLLSSAPQGTSLQKNAHTSYMETSSTVEQKNNLFKSLPPSNESSIAPPAIPPRLSIRQVDRKDLPPHPGRCCSHSSIIRRLMLHEHPKKPPRKKPLSFRRNDPDVTSSAAVQSDPTLTANGVASCNKNNYVNLDPEQERAALGIKLEEKSKAAAHNTEGAAQSTFAEATPAAPLEDNNNNNGRGGTREIKPEEENDCLDQKPKTKPDISRGIDCTPGISQSVPTLKEGIDEADLTEVSSSPPTSLDITPAKRVSASPPTPTPRHQPPTPDCPPPSPSTALLNIQRQILPGENRRSKDMETITDSSLTEKEEQQPEVEHRQAGSASDKMAPATLPRPRQKPTPLPRKSSLTSETRDLPRARSSSATEASVITMEGYSGGRPASSFVPGNVNREAAGSHKSSQQQKDQSSLGSGQSDPPSERPLLDTNSSKDVALRSTKGGDNQDSRASFEKYDSEPVQLRRSANAERLGTWDDHVFAGE